MFHHARTAAHNQVRQALFKLLKRHASADSKLAEETPMFLTCLSLKEVPTALVQQAGRSVQHSQIQAAVEILPWVVGARGMVRVDLLTPALDFLEIPKQKWTGILESLSAHR